MGKSSSKTKLEPTRGRTTQFRETVREMAVITQGLLTVERKETVSFDEAVNYLIEKGFEKSFKNNKSVA
jgi:hypothetical protein